MKRLIIGLFSAVLMGTGLVGITAGSASAACDQYTGCPDTSTHVRSPGPVHRGDSARICVVVRTSGNNSPDGFVTLTIQRKKGHFGYTATKPYHGKRCFGTPSLRKPGYYRVRAHFEGTDFRNSNDWTHFVVRRH